MNLNIAYVAIINGTLNGKPNQAFLCMDNASGGCPWLSNFLTHAYMRFTEQSLHTYVNSCTKKELADGRLIDMGSVTSVDIARIDMNDLSITLTRMVDFKSE